MGNRNNLRNKKWKYIDWFKRLKKRNWRKIIRLVDELIITTLIKIKYKIK